MAESLKFIQRMSTAPPEFMTLSREARRLVGGPGSVAFVWGALTVSVRLDEQEGTNAKPSRFVCRGRLRTPQRLVKQAPLVIALSDPILEGNRQQLPMIPCHVGLGRLTAHMNWIARPREPEHLREMTGFDDENPDSSPEPFP